MRPQNKLHFHCWTSATSKHQCWTSATSLYTPLKKNVRTTCLFTLVKTSEVTVEIGLALPWSSMLSFGRTVVTLLLLTWPHVNPNPLDFIFRTHFWIISFPPLKICLPKTEFQKVYNEINLKQKLKIHINKEISSNLSFIHQSILCMNDPHWFFLIGQSSIRFCAQIWMLWIGMIKYHMWLKVK